MKRTMLLSRILVLAAMTSLSCHKPASPETHYRVLKETRYDGNGVAIDSAFYTYNNRNEIAVLRVAGVQTNYYAFEYYDGRPIKRHQYADAALTQELGYRQFLYNGDYSVSEMDVYARSGTGFVKVYTVGFDYTGTMLTKVTAAAIANGSAVIEHTRAFTYGGSNVVAVSSTDYLSNPPEVLTVSLTYDNAGNYFRRFHWPLITDPAFDPTINDLNIALLFGQNNAQSISVNNITSSIAYLQDEKQNLSEMRFNDKPAIRYQYQSYTIPIE